MPNAIRKSFADHVVRIISRPSRNVDKQLSLRVSDLAKVSHKGIDAAWPGGSSSGIYGMTLLLLLTGLMALTGCGSGGYAGSGITSLSSSNVTIDAGQSFQVTASVSGNEPVSWSMAGASCSAATCGSVATGTDGTTSTYTAPTGITKQLKVTLTAALPGTNNSQTVSITVNPDPTISGTLPRGTVGTPYSATLVAAGGTAPLTWSISGALPSGLTFNPKTGVISGTPTTVGSSTFTAQIVDSSDVPYTTKTAETILVSTQISALEIAGNPPAGTVGVAYLTLLNASGGTAPYTFSVTSGSLPAGLALQSATGSIGGTPTNAGTANFTAQVEDASGTKASASFSILINPSTVSNPSNGTLTLSLLPGATVGVPYNATIGVTGGTAPYTCQQTAGNLPAGLTLSAACVVSGTPTVAGTSTMTVKATDSGSPALVTSGPEAITVSAAGSLTLSFPPSGTVGVPYSGSIGVAGGSAPYACALVSGSLPAGLTLGSGCGITGTPTTAGVSNFTVTATDSNIPQNTITGVISLTIVPGSLTLTLSTLPDATVGVPYTATIGVTGGTVPYSCQQTGGTLPAGLTLSSACVVSGTPTTAGTETVQVKSTDSSSPAETVSGGETITVQPSGSLSLTPPPIATVNKPYSGTIGVSGGTAPYSCSITAGSLPAGLTLGAGCVISGNPTTAGSSTVTVKATDTSNPVKTTTGPVTVTVAPAALSLTVTNLPNATVGTPYTATIGVSGGTSPYSCSIVSGTLPTGLALGAGCVVSGTPLVAGTVTLGVKATDSSSPVETTTGPVSLTVLPATTLTLSPPPNATVGQTYSGSIGVSGGTAPYTCALTAGTMPAGLTLAANCVVSGLPTTAGPVTVTVKATDSSNPAATVTGPVTITVLAATSTLTLSPPPNAIVTVPYTGTIGVSGGTAPYNCTLVSGTMPAGLTLGAACTVTGTPTTVGSSTVTIHATDSVTPTADTVTGPVVITVSAIPTLTLAGSLPNATLGVAYSQTLTAAGGVKPYTYSLTAGSLPPGLSLSSSTGTISGTPTQVGASSFTVTVTDTESTPQTASLPLVLLVVYPSTPTDSELTGPYAFLFQGYDDVLAGVLAYQTGTIGSFTADGLGGISDGESDANHQSSNPADNTVSTHSFIGTYTLGTDSRGLMTITTLNSDGTTGGSATYAITAKAPTAPATVSTQVDMIEFDDNNLQGTRGSGTMLAQQPAAFSAGLSGTFAFGLSGDTPCLPACTVGIIAGPAAAVGQFTTNGTGLLTSGMSDANIATKNYAKEPLTGSYGTADSNGRLDLNMETAGTPIGIYPSDYAVYMVNANQAFVMSTDKHSSFVLLAGTAQLQTQATFSNASMDNAIIGYENAQASPGLLGVTLGSVLNLSTATIFRATGNGAGTCDITNVDVAGVTGLVNGISGLLGSLTGLNALLGTYQSTGNSACTVAANGRGTLDYPNPTGLLGGLLLSPPAPREFYLISPNSGYFLETGYAGLGRFEPQTGNPYTLGSLDGTYVYASIPAASLASINSSGILVANGAGSATTTTDLNVGVGTINLLQLGVTATYPYTLTDATAGRFLLGTTIVVYEIAPGRFVLVDTNPLTTSPSISLLY
jgi:hypothetical protein